MSHINKFFIAILLVISSGMELSAGDMNNHIKKTSESSGKELSTFYSIENLSDIKSGDIDKLLQFQSEIKFESHAWTEEDFFEDSTLKSFHAELLRKWVRPFDWPSWEENGIAFYQEPDLLKRASLTDIVKLITFHVRKDRFSEGHLLEVIKDGHMNKILGQLRKIRANETLITKK